MAGTHGHGGGAESRAKTERPVDGVCGGDFALETSLSMSYTIAPQAFVLAQRQIYSVDKHGAPCCVAVASVCRSGLK